MIIIVIFVYIFICIEWIKSSFCLFFSCLLLCCFFILFLLFAFNESITNDLFIAFFVFRSHEFLFMFIRLLAWIVLFNFRRRRVVRLFWRLISDIVIVIHMKRVCFVFIMIIDCLISKRLQKLLRSLIKRFYFFVLHNLSHSSASLIAFVNRFLKSLNNCNWVMMRFCLKRRTFSRQILTISKAIMNLNRIDIKSNIVNESNSRMMMRVRVRCDFWLWTFCWWMRLFSIFWTFFSQSSMIFILTDYNNKDMKIVIV